MRWRATVSLAGLLLTSCGCVQSHFNVATQRQDYTITSTDKEVSLGLRMARAVEREVAFVEDAAVQARVRTIGERIVAVCGRQELVYQFTAIDEEEMNAFALPGGYVYVHQGLIDKTDSDDELAGVIAHEVAHIVARHAIHRYEGQLGVQLASLAAIASRDASMSRGVGVAIQSTRLAYARQDELEADRLAVTYMQEAGFDPNAILTFLEKLRASEERRDRYLPRGVVRPQYALTHPYVPERLRAVKEALYGVADYFDYLNTPE